RYVVMNRHEITFPFKRYQIQPVWRADRPQKGRYREFYQCDADVVGTDSLVCEAEIILMIMETFKGLGINQYTIKINHRGVLSGLAHLAGASDKENALFVAIDKLDKIGEDKVREELVAKGFSEEGIKSLFRIINVSGTSEEKLSILKNSFGSHPRATKSTDELAEVLNLVRGFGARTDNVEVDIALARGLSYYTGCIFEVKIHDVAIGSVSGGGRYDNLTAVFDSKEKSSGVGFSFGVDRLYDAMEELKIFPPETELSSRVLVCHLDEACMRYGLQVVQALRNKGIASEIYPDQVKLKKQLEYADKKKIPYTIVIGSDEMQSGVLAVKSMKTGEQHMLTLQQFISKL
ncbi:MAG: histidine--tRNA ligase, partial [Cyclobacteriaceae bacterium]|nr:histidine--tRNA ligase [Cyclobacteriaceae bacterium]